MPMRVRLIIDNGKQQLNRYIRSYRYSFNVS